MVLTLNEQRLTDATQMVCSSISQRVMNLPTFPNECGSLVTGPSRMVVFGRESMNCNAMCSIAPTQASSNQLLAEEFIRLANGINSESTDQPLNKFVSMSTLPVGKALMRLCNSVEPIEFLADGQLFSAGSLEGNSALIDAVARRFVEQGSGVLTASAHSAAPNTYLRCVEMQAIRENHNFSAVRVLQGRIQQFHPDLNVEAVTTIDSKLLTVADWMHSQKAQWWQRSINQLMSFHHPEQGIDTPLIDRDINEANARFIGELYQVSRELTYLDKKAYLTDSEQRERRAEILRLREGLLLLEEIPSLTSCLQDKTQAFALTRMFAYDIPADAKERAYVMDRGTDGDCISFATDKTHQLLENLKSYWTSSRL